MPYHRAYSSSRLDDEWAILQPWLPAGRAGGRPRTQFCVSSQADLRAVLNAVLYVLRGGVAWRLLPTEFPPWQTVHHYFRQWRQDGT